MCSMELRYSIDVASERSVVDVGASVVQVWHHWLGH